MTQRPLRKFEIVVTNQVRSKAAIEATDERDAQDKALLLWNSDDRAVHFTDHSFVDIEVKPVPKRFRVHYWIKQVCSIEIEAETANEAEFIVERRLDDTGDVLPDSAITVIEHACNALEEVCP